MAIESMYVFTGDEVVATDLPAKLNENFAKTETNMLKTVNNVAQDENHNINVTELIPKQITSNTNLNNLVTSGEYTFTKGSATITNSPTSNSFFLTVLRNNALVKQVVTEVVLDDPITYTRVLSGSSWSPWVEGGKVKTINSIQPDDSGNVDLSSMDYAVRSEIGIWKPNENVSVGDIRYLNGRENAGIVLECTQAGTTGTAQPIVSNSDNIVANYISNDRIGHMRLIFNLAEKDEDEVIALGVAYNRNTYEELWNWVQARPDLLITEEEWQTKFAETNGKFVPYYSSGNGTTTFRTPLLSAYIKGAGSSDEVGNYLAAGLPNITGTLGRGFRNYADVQSGALFGTELYNTAPVDGGYGAHGIINFDASRSNAIYGNSTTVTPESMVGIWVIKAFGIITDNNSTDISNVLNGIAEFESKVIPIEKGGTGATNASQACANIGALPLSGGAMTGNEIKRATKDDLLLVRGGNAYSTGASLVLYGKDEGGEYAGGFRLIAHNGTKAINLSGKTNGSLSWDSKNIECVNSVGSNYIRYESGVQICWGHIGNITTGAITSKTFPVAFSSSDITIVANRVSSATNTDTEGTVVITNHSVTNFSFILSKGIHINFVAIGRWK